MSRKGQSLIEYGAILTLIICTSIVVLNSMGQQAKNAYSKTSQSIQHALKQSDALLNNTLANIPTATTIPSSLSSSIPIPSVESYSDGFVDSYSSNVGGVISSTASSPEFPYTHDLKTDSAQGSDSIDSESSSSSSSESTEPSNENGVAVHGTSGTDKVSENYDSSLSSSVGHDVYKYPDGSIKMEINGQNFDFPKELLDNYKLVVETTGAYGQVLEEELLATVSTMVEVHKNEYPPGQVPVDINFGDYMEKASHGVTYNGNAQLSFANVSIGSDVRVIATLKEQTQNGANLQPVSCSDDSCRIYYDLNQTSTETIFNGNISIDGQSHSILLSWDKAPNTWKGTYSINTSSGSATREVQFTFPSVSSYIFRL